MTQMNTNAGPNHEWLLKMADVENSCPSISVGGMAADLLGTQPAATPEPQRVFGRLIEFARRAKGLSVEQLAQQADVAIAEIVEIEWHEDTIPQPRTVYQLAKALDLPSGRLIEVAGLAMPHRAINNAALRFAARSEPTAMLTREEREAFDEFIRVLVDISDG